jgi:tubulin-folding cofactor B
MSLSIFATHSTLGASFHPELKLHPDLTVGALKQKLHSFCGTEPAMQHLSLLDDRGVLIAELADDGASLSSVGALDGCTIHITDLDPTSQVAGLGEESAVEKVALSAEAEAARKARLAQFKKPKAPAVDDEYMAELAAPINVGAACEVAPSKLGTVRFVGKIPEIAPGWWVGVEYQEPVGKNDGSVKGARYFSCAPEQGGFVRPDKVVGAWSARS